MDLQYLFIFSLEDSHIVVTIGLNYVHYILIQENPILADTYLWLFIAF